MKILTVLVILASLALGCEQSEVVSEFTGNETTYSLQQTSEFEVSGTVILKERKDGMVTAFIQLSGTGGTSKHPVHLHAGDIASPGADIILPLNPVEGKTGRSETIIFRLADESTVDYQALIKLSACIKIHLGNTGADRDIILAAGNIGSAVTKSSINGRLGVGVCKSE